MQKTEPDKIELEEAQAQGGLLLVGLERQVKSQFDELPDELP
jgi:hypothetical protein